jgi:hypothetical protein
VVWGRLVVPMLPRGAITDPLNEVVTVG